MAAKRKFLKELTFFRGIYLVGNICKKTRNFLDVYCERERERGAISLDQRPLIREREMIVWYSDQTCIPDQLLGN